MITESGIVVAEPLPTEARHSMASADWMTPLWLVELARLVMGSIDLDPASDAEANARVGATHIYTAENSGLDKAWFGRVFLNPSGGLVADFWAKLLAEWQADRLEAAIWVGYSLEQLQTLQVQGEGFTPLDFPMCIPRKRIAFEENEAARAVRREKVIARGMAPGASVRTRKAAEACLAGKPPKNAPSHANYITYLGRHPHRFAKVFAGTGAVRL